MAAGATYTPIATTTLSSAQSSVTFSSISGSYTDLIIILNVAVASGNPSVSCQFNSDTGTNYSYTRLTGNGTSAASARNTNSNYMYFLSLGGATTTFETNAIGHINNYSNTTTYKTMLTRGNQPSGSTEAIVNLWRSTSAITSLTIAAGGINFSIGSTFTLYGIKAA